MTVVYRRVHRKTGHVVLSEEPLDDLPFNRAHWDEQPHVPTHSPDVLTQRVRTKVRDLIKYCEWQIDNGPYHPTLPSALSELEDALALSPARSAPGNLCLSGEDQQLLHRALVNSSRHEYDIQESDGGVEGHAAVPPEIPTQRSGASRDPLGDGSVKVGPHREDAAGVEPRPSDRERQINDTVDGWYSIGPSDPTPRAAAEAEREALIEALGEIANRAGNFADPDAAEWMPSIYAIACKAIGADSTDLLKATGFDGPIANWPAHSVAVNEQEPVRYFWSERFRKEIASMIDPDCWENDDGYLVEKVGGERSLGIVDAIRNRFAIEYRMPTPAAPSPTSQVGREALARAIDPDLFRVYDHVKATGSKAENGRLWADVAYQGQLAMAYERADRVIAALSPAAKVGS